MAVKQQQQQQGVVAAGPSVARRLWRVVRAVLYMLRRGLPSGRKLAMDLHLLLYRGKIAGKALGDLLASHHHGHHRAANAGGGGSSFSCRAVYEPSRGRRNRHHRDEAPAAANGYLHCYNYDAADVARMFEMLNDSDRLFSDDEPAAAATTAAYATTPSPAQLLWASARSPAVAPAASGSRKLRVTDSPFHAAVRDVDDAQVDRQADEFIRRFYEQLRAQKSAASTPDYYGHAPSPYAAARVAAGIAQSSK